MDSKAVNQFGIETMTTSKFHKWHTLIDSNSEKLDNRVDKVLLSLYGVLSTPVAEATRRASSSATPLLVNSFPSVKSLQNQHHPIRHHVNQSDKRSMPSKLWN